MDGNNQIAKKKKGFSFFKTIFFSNTIFHENFLCNMIIGFLIGTLVFVLSFYFIFLFNRMEVVQITYSNSCQGYYKICRVPLEIKKQITKPVFFFIQIPGLSQMAFPYRNSFSDGQMKAGVYVTPPTDSLKKECTYSITNEDIQDVYNTDLKVLYPDDTAFPCGLIPKYFPTDTFEAWENSTGVITSLTTLDIWNGNTRYKYKNSNEFAKQWLDIEDPRFFVWMKESSVSSPIKLWARLNQDISPGQYFVHINIAYNPSIFKQEKNIIITGNGTYFTNTNYFLVTLMVILGLLIYAMTVYIAILYFKNRRLNSKKF